MAKVVEQVRDYAVILAVVCAMVIAYRRLGLHRSHVQKWRIWLFWTVSVAILFGALGLASSGLDGSTILIGVTGGAVTGAGTGLIMAFRDG